MTRSLPESRIPTSVAFSESRPGSFAGSPAIAPSDFQDAAERQGADSTRQAWTAAFTLGACLVLAFVVAAVLGSGRGWPGVVGGAVAAALLLVTLVVLHRRYGALGTDVAGSDRRAAQWQRYAEELERRDDERQAYYSRTSSALADAVDRLVSVQLPAALNGSVPPESFPDSAAGGPAEVAALCERVTGAAAEGAAGLREQFDGQNRVVPARGGHARPARPGVRAPHPGAGHPDGEPSPGKFRCPRIQHARGPCGGAAGPPRAEPGGAVRGMAWTAVATAAVLAGRGSCRGWPDCGLPAGHGVG